MARTKMTDEERAEKAKLSRDKWRKENADKVKKYAKAYRLANPDKVKSAMNKWRLNNPEKVKSIQEKANKKWQQENPDKVKEANKLWREKNPDKVREYTKAWKLANPEKVRAIRKVDRLRRSWKQSRTPDGLMKLIDGMKWAKYQIADGEWHLCSWVVEVLNDFPAAGMCKWLDYYGYGLRIIGGTTFHFFHVSDTGESCDEFDVVLGYKRIRNLEKLKAWMTDERIKTPARWDELDFEPDRHEWACELRNFLGHDLTRIKTELGAKSKRFPCAVNLAAIEQWMNENECAGELEVDVSVVDHRLWASIRVRDLTVYRCEIRKNGSIAEGAITEAVDALKRLPKARIVSGEFVPFSEVVE